MDKLTYQKYKFLEKNNELYKLIWNIKNNDERNNKINYIIKTIRPKKLIKVEKLPCLVAGMPMDKVHIYLTIYYNIYTNKVYILSERYTNYIIKNSTTFIFCFDKMFTTYTIIPKTLSILNRILIIEKINHYKNKYKHILYKLFDKIFIPELSKQVMGYVL